MVVLVLVVIVVELSQLPEKFPQTILAFALSSAFALTSLLILAPSMNECDDRELLFGDDDDDDVGGNYARNCLFLSKCSAIESETV